MLTNTWFSLPTLLHHLLVKLQQTILAPIVPHHPAGENLLGKFSTSWRCMILTRFNFTTYFYVRKVATYNILLGGDVREGNSDANYSTYVSVCVCVSYANRHIGHKLAPLTLVWRTHCRLAVLWLVVMVVLVMVVQVVDPDNSF